MYGVSYLSVLDSAIHDGRHCFTLKIELPFHFIANLKVGLSTETHLLLGLPNTRLGVIRIPLLKEVILPLQRNPFHELKGVRHIEYLRVAQLSHQTVCYELNVLRHQSCVHPNQFARQSLRNEILLNRHCLLDNLINLALLQLILDLAIQEASEIRVHPLIP